MANEQGKAHTVNPSALALGNVVASGIASEECGPRSVETDTLEGESPVSGRGSERTDCRQ